MEKHLVGRRRREIVSAVPASICNDFPLRPGYLAQIVVPRDMTTVEAARLAEFIKALALPDSGRGEP